MNFLWKALTWPLAEWTTQAAAAAALGSVTLAPKAEPSLVEGALEQLAEWERERKGEVGRNNRGPFIRWISGRKKANWCASVLVAALEISAAGLGVILPFATDGKHRLGAKRFARNVGAAGSFIDLEHGILFPGDILCYHRGPRGSWQGHVRMVVAYDKKTRLIQYVAGNEGSFPSVVRYETVSRDARDLVMIARLPPSMLG